MADRQPRNERSRSVAAKLGIRVERQVHNPVLGLDVDLWSIGGPEG